MKFSVMSWNVEAFKGEGGQLNAVVDHIRALEPDVFGLFEVENVNITAIMQTHLPEYNYLLTDGPQNKEILAGAKAGKFQQITFSQKREFKVYNPYLRPGSLVTVTFGNEVYNILFLHTDSGTDAAGFGNRFEMFDKVWKVKKAIDKLSDNGKGRLIVLGDLNTMGLQYPAPKKSNERVAEGDEIAALGLLAADSNMRVLGKEFDKTFNNLKLRSDLDHILATNNLSFTQFKSGAKKFEVKVTGWQQLKGEARKDFIRNISDHCSLYCEVK